MSEALKMPPWNKKEWAASDGILGFGARKIEYRVFGSGSGSEKLYKHLEILVEMD